MLVITKFPLTTKQAPSIGSIKQLTIRIEIESSNIELANLIVNPNITLVSKDEFRAKINEINNDLETNINDIKNNYQKLSEKGQNQGYAPLDNTKKIPMEFIPQTLIPFCVNSCPADNFLSFQGNIITVSAPFTYTTADGNTFTVNNNLTLNAASLTPAAGQSVKYNLFVKENSGTFSLSAFANSIYTQMSEPSNPNPNDIWLETLEPFASYIRNNNVWQKSNLVPIGSFTISN